MVAQIASIRGLVLEIDPAISLDQRRELRWNRTSQVTELFALDQAVQRDGGGRTCVGPRPRAVTGFVVPKDAAGNGRRPMPPGLVPARVPPCGLHIGHRCLVVRPVCRGAGPPPTEHIPD